MPTDAPATTGVYHGAPCTPPGPLLGPLGVVMQCSRTRRSSGHLTGQGKPHYVSSSPHDRGRSAAVRTLKVPCTDRQGRAFRLADKGKADASTVRTVKCRTVLEGRFRHLNYIRTLPAHVIDEPPALLGDDTAPNPTEALLAALGSCLSVGIHANAVARGITLYKVELELEGDINITSVWG